MNGSSIHLSPLPILELSLGRPFLFDSTKHRACVRLHYLHIVNDILFSHGVEHEIIILHKTPLYEDEWIKERVREGC